RTCTWICPCCARGPPRPSSPRWSSCWGWSRRRSSCTAPIRPPSRRCSGSQRASPERRRNASCSGWSSGTISRRARPTRWDAGSWAATPSACTGWQAEGSRGALRSGRQSGSGERLEQCLAALVVRGDLARDLVPEVLGLPSPRRGELGAAGDDPALELFLGDLGMELHADGRADPVRLEPAALARAEDRRGVGKLEDVLVPLER